MRLGAPATGKRSGGAANIKGLDFTTGVFEFDMLVPDAMEFSGPMFHQPDELTGEFIYFRPHMNGKPDAIQYSPVVNGNLSWQIFSGPGFEAETVFPVGRWMRVQGGRLPRLRVGIGRRQAGPRNPRIEERPVGRSGRVRQPDGRNLFLERRRGIDRRLPRSLAAAASGRSARRDDRSVRSE